MASQGSTSNFLFNSYPYVPVTWFPIGKRELVENKCQKLHADGVKKIRIGIDYNNDLSNRKAKWYRWLLSTLTEGLEVEPCFVKSPSRVSDLRYKPLLAEAIEEFVHSYGEAFTTVGLWRCQQNRISNLTAGNIYEQDFVFAISWSKYLGKKVNLGGICRADFNWILRMISSQVLKNVAVITLDPVDEDNCRYNHSFYRILKSLLEAKELDIAIHSPFLSDSSVKFRQTEPKSALLNTNLKITG